MRISGVIIFFTLFFSVYVEASMAPYSYGVKILDTNGDGKQDIYVTGGISRTVDDFIIHRYGNGSYSLTKNPTSSQRSAAAGTSYSEDVGVVRRDYSGDALYDFQIYDIGYAIPGEYDLIVTTEFGNGQTPKKIIPIDDKFLTLRAQIEDAIDDASTFIAFNQSMRCEPTYSRQIPIVGDFFDFEDNYWYWLISYQLRSYSVDEECEMGYDILEQTLPWDQSQFIGALDAMEQRYNNFPYYNSTYSSLSVAVPAQKILDAATAARKAVKWVRQGAIIATVIILADDITIIGVADDVGLIGTLGAYGVAIIADEILVQVISILQQAVASGNPDVGHVNASAHASAGAYAIPNQCDPEDPNQDIGNPNKSRPGKLEQNMSDAGCWCDGAAQGGGRNRAHHIVPKADPKASVLRDCMVNQHGIGLDDAHNGVCLPGSQDAKETAQSDAFLHRGRENTLHGPEVLEKLTNSCQNMSTQQFKSYLRQTAAQYSQGLPPL